MLVHPKFAEGVFKIIRIRAFDVEKNIKGMMSGTKNIFVSCTLGTTFKSRTPVLNMSRPGAAKIFDHLDIQTDVSKSNLCASEESCKLKADLCTEGIETNSVKILTIMNILY